MCGKLAHEMQVVEMKVILCCLRAGTPAAARLAARWATKSDVGYAAKKGAKGSSSLLARAALRALLRLVAGADADAWRIEAGENGKPFLQDENGALGPAISMSHGGDWVAAAVGPPGMKIGVDVEPHQGRDVISLAGWAFGPDERQMVAKDGVAAFYRLWTLREAMGKATGQGLRLAADGVDRVGAIPCDGVWRRPGWSLGYWPGPGYSLAVAVETPGEAAVDVRLLSLDEICR